MMKIYKLEDAVRQEDAKKKVFVAAKRMDDAKRSVIRKHRLLQQKVKYEKLYVACESMRDGVDAAKTLRETVSTLQEVSAVFKGGQMNKWPEKMAQITEDFEGFHDDYRDLVDRPFSSSEDIEDDEELQRELKALLETPDPELEPESKPVPPPANPGEDAVSIAVAPPRTQTVELPNVPKKIDQRNGVMNVKQLFDRIEN